ncbi:MAG: hypothetical protein A2Z11_02535 [Candidatus Woykebacteria bacterium RBG_16_43_9]|uniref:Uncharacterized protein n=1 Tax=Candidatus Woykebacteria bacterium RBG_16_43_9 TaxID=1802596 RepID=A0A1G1WFI9_9BACT|nr:MAG: hypothetical protein A2Z11_02535 [Candidatus Woykebacteria bacterium RBG_16_43_9]
MDLPLIGERARIMQFTDNGLWRFVDEGWERLTREPSYHQTNPPRDLRADISAQLLLLGNSIGWWLEEIAKEFQEKSTEWGEGAKKLLTLARPLTV